MRSNLCSSYSYYQSSSDKPFARNRYYYRHCLIGLTLPTIQERTIYKIWKVVKAIARLSRIRQTKLLQHIRLLLAIAIALHKLPHGWCLSEERYFLELINPNNVMILQLINSCAILLFVIIFFIILFYYIAVQLVPPSVDLNIPFDVTLNPMSPHISFNTSVIPFPTTGFDISKLYEVSLE